MDGWMDLTGNRDFITAVDLQREGGLEHCQEVELDLIHETKMIDVRITKDMGKPKQTDNRMNGP